MPYGLNNTTLYQLKKVFAKYIQIKEVIIYGSRAKGNHTEGSDIDLSLKGENLDYDLLHKVSEDIETLLLPYLIDINAFSAIKNKELIDHITRVGISIYKKNPGNTDDKS